MPSWRAGRDAGWLPDRGAHCALSPDHPAVLTRVRAQLVVQVREEQGSRRLHRPLPCPRLPGTGSPGPPSHSDVSLGPRAQSKAGEKKGRLIPDVPSWGSEGALRQRPGLRTGPQARLPPTSPHAAAPQPVSPASRRDLLRPRQQARGAARKKLKGGGGQEWDPALLRAGW